MVKFSLVPKIPWAKTVTLGIITLAAFLIIFRALVRIQDVASVVRGIDQAYFWLAFATIVPSVILMAVRWYFVLRASDYRVPFRKILTAVISSMPFSIFPSKLGDVARAYPLRHAIPPAKSIGSIVLEKIMDVFVLLMYALVGLLLLDRFQLAALILLIAFALVFFALAVHRLFIGWSSVGGVRQHLYDASSILPVAFSNKAVFACALAASALNWGLSMLQLYLLFRSVHVLIPWATVIAYLPLSIFVGLLPFTLAGAGTRDAALVYFFQPFVLPGHTLTVGILYGLQGYWIPAIVCIPFLYSFFRAGKNMDNDRDSA